jgi:hypothetical protein
MRYFGALSQGNASVIWRANHSAVGFWVTAIHLSWASDGSRLEPTVARRIWVGQKAEEDWTGSQRSKPSDKARATVMELDHDYLGEPIGTLPN